MSAPNETSKDDQQPEQQESSTFSAIPGRLVKVPMSRKPKKLRGPKQDQVDEMQQMIMILHHVVHQFHAGTTGDRGGVNWEAIGNQFGYGEGGKYDVEDAWAGEKVRSRFRKSFEKVMKGRPGVEAMEDPAKLSKKEKPSSQKKSNKKRRVNDDEGNDGEQEVVTSKKDRKKTAAAADGVKEGKGKQVEKDEEEAQK